MNRLLVILCIVAPLILANKWPAGFKVRYMDTETGIGETSFIALPQNVTAAKSMGWTKVNRPDGPAQYSSLELWCPSDDYNIGVLYDDTEYACGLQMALLKDDLSNMPFDMETVGFVDWTTTINGEKKKLWAISQYYISDENLALDSATRSSMRDPAKFWQDENVYVTGPYGKLYNISLNVENIKNSDFKKQKCIAAMGTHYYYKMSSELECLAENMMPWFIIVDENQVTGISFYTYGKRTQSMGSLNYMEEYNTTAQLESVFSDASDCVMKYGTSPYGLIEMHIYGVETPYNITCSD